MGQVEAECIAAEVADSASYPGMYAAVASWKHSVVVEPDLEGVAVAVDAVGRNFVVLAADIWTDVGFH